LGVPSTLVTEAVYARCLSAMKPARVRASKVLKGPSGKYAGNRTEFIEQVRQALYASKICSYAQGYVQMQAAAVGERWRPLSFGPIALLWRGGCIIRCSRTDQRGIRRRAEPENLLLAPSLCRRRTGPEGMAARRDFRGRRVAPRRPSPALAHYDGYRSERPPANLLQARAAITSGAHTYNRETTRRACSTRTGCIYAQGTVN
jgi:6-phosphogluconate dehydrogenase